MALVLPIVIVLALMTVPAFVAWARGVETGIYRQRG